MPLSIYQSTSTISLYYHFLPLLSLIYYLTVSPYNPSLLTLYHCYIPLLSLNRSIFTTSFSNCSTINVSLYYPSINQLSLYHKITPISQNHATITGSLHNHFSVIQSLHHFSTNLSLNYHHINLSLYYHSFLYHLSTLRLQIYILDNEKGMVSLPHFPHLSH